MVIAYNNAGICLVHEMRKMNQMSDGRDRMAVRRGSMNFRSFSASALQPNGRSTALPDGHSLFVHLPQVFGRDLVAERVPKKRARVAEQRLLQCGYSIEWARGLKPRNTINTIVHSSYFRSPVRPTARSCRLPARRERKTRRPGRPHTKLRRMWRRRSVRSRNWGSPANNQNPFILFLKNEPKGC